MNRFERAISISQNGGGAPRFELPTNPQELQSPESLSIVLRNAQKLLSDYAIFSLPRIAERFEQDGSSSDPDVRGQIQEELVQVGLRMQQFGALLLDLGSSILTLRLEQSTVDLQDLAERVVSTNCPMDVFRAVVESSARISGSSTHDIANHLCTHDSLAEEYLEILASDITRRLQSNSEQED
ncbi:hypothetical protein IC582_015256 [Cucumis melo]|uniref:Uncharacterized protein LOC103493795 isoform X1 n=2 Tax=Cucumis melo TaxID=3656 RepID=A0A1S3BV17_CUCME|nr:uncharacterized protein LOC103493795 isoform X1 [Cucumis melo]KAA0064626.1 large proline-rich protein bag6-B isoform X1 [Cucumis melo var. makuwa]